MVLAQSYVNSPIISYQRVQRDLDKLDILQDITTVLYFDSIVLIILDEKESGWRSWTLNGERLDFEKIQGPTTLVIDTCPVVWGLPGHPLQTDRQMTASCITHHQKGSRRLACALGVLEVFSQSGHRSDPCIKWHRGCQLWMRPCLGKGSTVGPGCSASNAAAWAVAWRRPCGASRACGRKRD